MIRTLPALLIIFLTVSTASSTDVKKPESKQRDMTAASLTYKDPVTGMELVHINGGCYKMGDTFGGGYGDEKPVHEVCLDNFYIGKYEVTQRQWKKITGSNPSYFKACGGNCPVEGVSWIDIQDFIKRLNRRTDGKYRLPTEAEWEYACRGGGENEKFAGGSNADNIAWYSFNSKGETHPVGRKIQNGLSVYDMSGNVWEWVADWYDGNYYKSSPKSNPQGPGSGSYRVFRGGSWSSDREGVRCTVRETDAPERRFHSVGFRLARTP